MLEDFVSKNKLNCKASTNERKSDVYLLVHHSRTNEINTTVTISINVRLFRRFYFSFDISAVYISNLDLKKKIFRKYPSKMFCETDDHSFEILIV